MSAAELVAVRRGGQAVARFLVQRLGTRGVLVDASGEEQLAGGNASGAVVRAGDTVRKPWLATTGHVAAYLQASLGGQSRESFRVLFLDRGNGLIADELMGAGTVDHAPVYPREVVRRALELAACSCCLVHNHPSGDPNPSKADIEMTRLVVEACRALAVTVHDHFLVVGDQFVSLRALGVM